MFNGDLSTTEEEKRDSHRCSLFLQPAFHGSLSSRLLPALGGTSGTSLGVYGSRNKKSSLFIFRVLSKTGSTGRRRSYVTEMFASVVSGVESCVIYLLLILKQQFSAVGVFLLQVLDVGFLRRQVAAVTISGRGAALFLLGKTWQFQSFDFFFFYPDQRSC